MDNLTPKQRYEQQKERLERKKTGRSKTADAPGAVKMVVNREQNFEFEKYPVQDGDQIEIVYE